MEYDPEVERIERHLQDLKAQASRLEDTGNRLSRELQEMERTERRLVARIDGIHHDQKSAHDQLLTVADEQSRLEREMRQAQARLDMAVGRARHREELARENPRYAGGGHY